MYAKCQANASLKEVKASADATLANSRGIADECEQILKSSLNDTVAPPGPEVLAPPTEKRVIM